MNTRIIPVQENENVEWRKLYNEELHSLYHSPNILRVIRSRRMSWERRVARLGESRISAKILIGIPRRWSLGGPRHRWEDNIRIYLK